MHRTVTCTLRASDTDTAKLARTQTAFTAACNDAARVAFRESIFNRVRLHHTVYYRLRAEFGLLAEFAVRAIAVVAAAYKRDKLAQRHFRPNAAVVYDERLYRLEPKGSYQRVSLSTLDGRILCDLTIGGHQRRLLAAATKIGQADVFQDHKGRWRMALSIVLPEPEPQPPGDMLGVDLGIVNIAADSDGTCYSGAHVNGLRRRSHRLRKTLQAKGTKSARRRLKSWRGKQQRFQRDVNHCISKQIVAKAAGTHRGIAVEDLNGISRRLAGKVSKDQRRLLHGWGFFQLRTFLTYKAETAGIPVIAVDPRYTSQTCPVCGLIDRKNRPNQSTFRCIGCGFAGVADIVAATNIARRGTLVVGLPVNQPYVGVSCGTSVSHGATYKLPALAGGC